MQLDAQSWAARLEASGPRYGAWPSRSVRRRWPSHARRMTCVDGIIGRRRSPNSSRRLVTGQPYPRFEAIREGGAVVHPRRQVIVIALRGVVDDRAAKET